VKIASFVVECLEKLEKKAKIGEGSDSPSMLHLVGGGKCCDTSSIYDLMETKFFSQNCWTGSRIIWYGSKVLIR